MIAVGGGMAAGGLWDCWDLPAEPSIAAKAREIARSTLAGWGLDALVDDVVLMLDEAVTNAIVHGRGPLTVCLRQTGRTPAGEKGEVLVCEVTDTSPDQPKLRAAGWGDETGRGLWIIQQLAWRCGARRIGPGKAFWFAIRLA